MASDFPAYVAQHIDDGTQVEDYPFDTTTAWIPGDFVYYDTTANEMTRCGADPALIAGISEVDSVEAVLITEDGLGPIRLLKDAAVIALSSATTPAQSHVGDQYGITRNAAGHWQLDTGKTGADARVLVKRVDITNGVFFCQVLNDQLQFNAVA